MIKGKKIGDINLKVTMPIKTTQKAVGVPLGKFYIPEKTQISQQKPRNQFQNQEDEDIIEEKCKNDYKQQNTLQQMASSKTTQTKVNEKMDPLIQKYDKKEKKEIKENTKKSVEKSGNRKQNRNQNNAPKKQLTTGKNLQSKRNLQQQNRQISKTTKAINNSQAAASSAKVNFSEKQKDEVRQTKEKAVELKVKDVEVAQNHKQEEYLDQDEMEQERRYLPHPYVKQLQTEQLLINEEISFQNDDFQLRMEKEPIRYQSSEEDSNEDSNYRIKQKDTINSVDFPAEVTSLQRLALNINSQLFSLSAQQLLAKDYFNVWQSEQ